MSVPATAAAAVVEYELATQQTDSHLRACGLADAINEPAVNTGALLRRLALCGDETALECLIGELSAGIWVDALSRCPLEAMAACPAHSDPPS